jgi:hypothetical protein
VSSITPSQKYSDESAGSTELDVVVVEVVEAGVPVATADEVDDAAELVSVAIIILLPGGCVFCSAGSKMTEPNPTTVTVSSMLVPGLIVSLLPMDNEF